MRGTRFLIGVVVFWMALSAGCMGTTPSPYTSPRSTPEAVASADEPAANETASTPGRSEVASAAPASRPGGPPPSESQSQFAPPPSATPATASAASEPQFAPPSSAGPAARSTSLPPPAPRPPEVDVTGSVQREDSVAPATSPAPSSPRAEETPRLRAPRERPGLATQWGETRESHVRDVDFNRAEPGRPFAVAKVYYNDRAGVDALAAYHGGGPVHPLELTVANGAITVFLIDEELELPLDAVRAGDRTYVVGEEGHRYGIRLLNRTARRVEVVGTVDGLDVINGRSGSYHNRGYILGPWETLDIEGFRRSEDEVAAFRFSRVSDSYAAQRGSARDVGVIGIAFFAQRGDDWSNGELRIRDTAQPFPREGRFAPPPPLDPM